MLETTVGIYLIDTVTGAVVFHTYHKNAQVPLRFTQNPVGEMRRVWCRACVCAINETMKLIQNVELLTGSREPGARRQLGGVPPVEQEAAQIRDERARPLRAADELEGDHLFRPHRSAASGLLLPLPQASSGAGRLGADVSTS